MRAVEETLARLAGLARPYGLLLALVQHGYRHLLQHLHSHINKLHATQAMLEQTTNPYGRLREERIRSLELETLNRTLTRHLEEADCDRSARKDELAKLEVLLGEERRRGLCLEDEKRRLEADLLEATVEAGALRRKLATFIGEDGPASDPQLLKIALQKCREDLSVKTRLLLEMERQYREVVPRADYDRQQRRLTALTNTHKHLTHAHDLLKEQHETILCTQEALVTERDRLSQENQALRRAATPRPDWNRVAEYVEGGIGRWREVSSGKTTDQLVDVLISELTGAQLSSAASELIDCKGMEAGVPAYLRYEGCVRNRRLGKRDLILIVDDIWREKRRLASKDSMEVFVDQYFRERYHLEEVRAEWCYSLADACQRLAHEEQIGLFWGILCGQVEEQVYHHQVDSVKALYAALRSRDPEDKGVVSREVLRAAIKAVFPVKSDNNVQVLMDIAGRSASLKDPSVLKYHNLFSQGSSGARTPLVAEVLQQARDEQDSYIQEVLDELGYSAMDVAVNELSRAFTMVDPRIEQRQLDAYLEWVFNTTKDQLKSISPIPLPLLAARLQTGHIVRVGSRT
ncbi:translin-associated factor X-interacting protein 1-like [Panulirus ornatus]|uniref:translin-associated factor X-interacting protein 1-like n=1 Tax=Panulirus ornatus TaxID=150431 RepID=UPI003A8BB3CB